MHRKIGKGIKPLIHSLFEISFTVISTFMLISKGKNTHMLLLTVQTPVTAASNNLLELLITVSNVIA